VARAKLPKWAIKKAGGINKKAWRLARAGRKRSSPSRRKARASPKRRSMARKRMAVPHPSVTGMAAGFSILDDLNGGNGRTVIDLVVGQNPSYNLALKQLSHNAQALVKTPSGRTSLLQAVGIAAVGAWARKALPATKLGGSKLYFRP